MSYKRNFIIGIMDDTKISQVNGLIAKYATVLSQYTSFLFFKKQPIDGENIVKDITMFQLEAADENSLNRQLDMLIDELNGFDADYVLGDDDTKEIIVTIDHVGKLFIKFDNIKTLHKGTFEKINQLKQLKSEFGYCKGFRPPFRPMEGNSIEDMNVPPEIVYLISDSEENLMKLNDHISRQILEINPDFICEFKVFKI